MSARLRRVGLGSLLTGAKKWSSSVTRRKVRSYSDELAEAEAEAVALRVSCISVAVDHRYQNIETSSLSALLEMLSGPLRIRYIGRIRFIHLVMWSSFWSYPTAAAQSFPANTPGLMTRQNLQTFTKTSWGRDGVSVCISFPVKQPVTQLPLIGTKTAKGDIATIAIFIRTEIEGSLLLPGH